MPSLTSDAATAGAALNQHMSGMLMEAMFDGYSPQTDGQAEHTAMRSLVQQISSASGDRIPEVLNALLARPAMGDASRAREQLMDPLIGLADQLPASLIPVFLTVISHLQYKFIVPEHREIVLRALGLLSRCSASDEHTAVMLTAIQTLNVRLADLPPDTTSIVLRWYEQLGHDAQGTAYRVQYLACLHAEPSQLLVGSIEQLREDVQKHLSVITQSSQGAWHLLRCLAQLHASLASTKEQEQREEGDRCEGRAWDLLPADRLAALFTQSLSLHADTKAILSSLIHWQALGGSFASLSFDAVRVLEERLLSAFDTMDQRTFRLIEQALQALGATREALGPKLTAAMDQLDGYFCSSSSTEGTEQLKRFAVMMRKGRVQADPQLKAKIAAKVRALIALMPSGELMTVMKELRALVGIAITAPVLASELIQPLIQLADRMPRMLLVEYLWSVAGCMYQFKDNEHRPLVLRAVGLLADLTNPTDLELTAVQDSMKKMHIRFGDFPDALKAAMLTSLDAMQRDGHGTETALRYLTAVLATCDHLPKATSASLLEDVTRNADYFLQSSHKAVWVLSALSRMHFQPDDLPVDAQQFIANVFAKSLPVPTFWLEERKAVAEQVSPPFPCCCLLLTARAGDHSALRICWCARKDDCSVPTSSTCIGATPVGRLAEQSPCTGQGVEAHGNHWVVVECAQPTATSYRIAVAATRSTSS